MMTCSATIAHFSSAVITVCRNQSNENRRAKNLGFATDASLQPSNDSEKKAATDTQTALNLQKRSVSNKR